MYPIIKLEIISLDLRLTTISVTNEAMIPNTPQAIKNEGAVKSTAVPVCVHKGIPAASVEIKMAISL